MKSFPDVSKTLRHRRSAENKRAIAGGQTTHQRTINMECSLAADTRRIFTALTVPEYIETWICVPGYHPECQNVTCRIGHEFQIEHLCNSGPTTRISGTYLSLLKRKLSFSWKSAGPTPTHESLVDIRLHGDFEKSILRLRHFDLDSEESFNWHSDLWSASMTRLRKLFDRPSSAPDMQRQRTGGGRSELLSEL
jgi:uncharacterized protein YndB with AHSA1/START domain